MMLLGILALVVLLAYLPMMIEHCKVLWRLEQYQYFPFIIAAVGWMAWARWQEATLREDRTLTWYQNIWHNYLPILGVLLAFVTLAVAVYCQWGWFAAVSLNLLTGAGLLVLSKYFHVRNAWGIWALMWLMVPPPIEFGANVVQRMQLVSSNLGSQILDLLGIDHLMAGNTFTVPTLVSTAEMVTEYGKDMGTPITKDLFVDEACSGIVSVMSIIAATGIYAVWKDRSLIHSGLLMLASVLWALVMNTVRLVVIAIAESKFQIDLASGAAHEILGLVLFSFTFIASMSTDQFLEFLLSPIRVQPGESGVRRNPLVKAWNGASNIFSPRYVEPNAEQSKLNRLLTGLMSPKLMMCGVPIAGIGIWSALVFFGIIGGRPESRVDALTLNKAIVAEDIAETIGDWQRVSYEATQRGEDAVVGNYDFGQFSNAFTFQPANSDATMGAAETSETVNPPAMVSMDYPFTGGWHELSACYRANGWDILEREAVSEGGREFVQTTYKYPNQEHYGLLLFNNFNERGEVLTPPSGAILVRSWLFIRRRFLRKIAGDLYQVQTFVTSDKPFSEDDKSKAKQLFLEAEKALTARVAK